jgi:hypothetical protein
MVMLRLARTSLMRHAQRRSCAASDRHCHTHRMQTARMTITTVTTTGDIFALRVNRSAIER